MMTSGSKWRGSQAHGYFEPYCRSKKTGETPLFSRVNIKKLDYYTHGKTYFNKNF
jgi:hypothetical protein